MTLTALLNKRRYRDPTVFPAWEVLRMGTIEGARAIGLGDTVGSLEVSTQADLILGIGSDCAEPLADVGSAGARHRAQLGLRC